MTPVKKQELNTISPFFQKWIMGLLASIVLAVGGFIIYSYTQFAVMQSNDKYREERVKNIDENVSTLINEMRTIKDNELRDIKDRLKTLEVQNDEDRK